MGKLNSDKRDQLLAMAKKARIAAIHMMGRAGGGHIGGALSIIEILAYLYGKEMNITVSNLAKPGERDRFVLSKGHAGPGLYGILLAKGFIPEEWIDTLNQPGTRLPSHCNMALTPGVDFTTGSLGQGFSVAVGMALADKMRKSRNRVFTLIGDGESQEGQIWESAMFAAHHQLGNLVAFTDNNKLQLDGVTSEILGVEDLVEKWKAFGWQSCRIDGHDFDAIDSALRAADNATSPTMIILDTLKCKGFAPGENITKNHHMAFSFADAEKAIADLALQK